MPRRLLCIFVKKIKLTQRFPSCLYSSATLTQAGCWSHDALLESQIAGRLGVLQRALNGDLVGHAAPAHLHSVIGALPLVSALALLQTLMLK